MNFTDFIIVYLACGAPFGVFYYIQHRENSFFGQNIPMTLLKCGLITLFWIPFAITLLQGFVTKKLQKFKFAETNQVDSSLKENTEVYEKAVLQILFTEKIQVSPFEFRETLERFVGLTLNCASKFIQSNTTISEFYQISDHENTNLASICLNRRNRLRLEHHQTLARRDFLLLIEIINTNLNGKTNFPTLSFEFAKLINDVEFTTKLEQIFDTSAQNKNDFIVIEREQNIWNPIKPKQLPTTEAILNLPAISTTTTMLKPD